MPVKNTGTDLLIKVAAKRLLFAEGRLYATTQEIADAVGINRSALHYYYQTRDQLIAEIFQESMQTLSLRLDKAMCSALPFTDKIDDLIEMYLTEMIDFPYLETFMVAEINSAGKQLVASLNEGPVVAFLQEVSQEMEAGRIEKMNPVHFLINLASLVSYPIIMSPLYQQFFRMSKDEFDHLIQERRKLVKRMLFKL